MPDTADVLRQSIRIYVDALRRIDAVTVILAPGGSTEDALDAYGKALEEAKRIARQALPITY